MAFANAAILFIILEVDFIALIFLIVYVGAIAILFLFVIMMLNLMDLGNVFRDMSNYIPVGFVVGVVVFFEVLIFLSSKVGGLMEEINNFRCDFIEKVSNVEVLGRVLYIDYFYFFLLASFILLGAMIGAIVLTREFEIVEKSKIRNNTIQK